MQTVIVLAIIAAAAVYVGRVFYKGVTAKNSCGGCTSCQSADSCSDPHAAQQRPSDDRADPDEAGRAQR